MTDTEDDPFKNPEHLANTADSMGRVCKDWQTSTARYHFACRDTIRALLAQLADAKAAQALVVELFVHECEQNATYYLGAGDPRKCAAFVQAAKEARQLADTDGLALVQALRAERDDLRECLKGADARNLNLGQQLQDANAANAALEAQVARLVGALGAMRKRAMSTRGEQAYRELPAFVLNTVRAALAEVQADARREGGE